VLFVLRLISRGGYCDPGFPDDASSSKEVVRLFHSSHPNLFGRPDAVVANSDLLCTTIGDLRRVSGFLLGYAPQAMNEAGDLLSDFSARLSMYFDAEEASGYFGTICTDCPELQNKVVALEQTHTELRDAVASLRRLAHQGVAAADLSRRIGVVIDDFEAHEQAERRLLRDFFLSGQGSGE
jgi:hypothetical protein